jgi:SAM-dependent methyltransferase
MTDSVLPPATTRGHEETAVFETSVVPRYFSMFGERVLARLAAGKDARVIHLFCRTGYPDRELVERLPNAHVHGVDPSNHAIELARIKAHSLVEHRTGVAFDYRVADTVPLAFPASVFSHGLTLQAPAQTEARRAMIGELARLIAPRGQALVAMPLRGSFFELHDLLRECGLKHEIEPLGHAVDAAAALRPTEEAFKRELEVAGFDHVEVDVRTRTLRFDGGARFFEDPITRLAIVPELRTDLGHAANMANGIEPLSYVRDAIDKYWSDATFELTVQVGVASGRRT